MAWNRKCVIRHPRNKLHEDNTIDAHEKQKNEKLYEIARCDLHAKHAKILEVQVKYFKNIIHLIA